jgi:hypothetical protein
MADRNPKWAEGPVALEDFEDLHDFVEASKPLAGPGIQVNRTPNGSVITSTGTDRIRTYRVIIPAGGVAANSSTAVYYYGAAHTNSGSQVTVWNRLTTTVGSSNTAVTGWATWVDPEAEYQLVQRSGCP